MFMERLVTYIGKILKTDPQYLIRGGFYVGIEYIASVLIGVSFGFFVANIFDPYEYGTYKYILSIVGVVGAFTLTGLATSLTQATARGYEGMWRLIIMTQLKWSVPATIVGISVSIFYVIQEAYLLAGLIAFVSFIIPIRDASNLVMSYLGGKELFDVRAKLNISRAFFGTVLLAGIIFWSTDPKLAVFTQYSIETIGFVFITIYVWKKFPPNDRIVHDEIPFGKHVSIIDVIQRAFGYADKLIVFQFLGAVPLAMYSIALMPVIQLSSMNKAMKQLVAPRFAKRSFKDIHASIMHKAITMTVISGVIVCLYSIVSPYLYTHLLPKYIDAIVLGQIASVSLLFSAQTLIGQALLTHKCTKELYVCSIADTASLVVCVSIGVFVGGVYGAITGFVVNKGINLIFAIYAYRHALIRMG